MDRLRSLQPIGALVLLLACAGGCAHARLDDRAEPARPERPAAEPASVFVGEASYYGHRHAGRRTASGVRFRPEALTCAHRSLKFGTRLRVTNLENGRSTQVVVNDRGPFVRGRILDVSLGAAQQLAMVRQGKARVRIEVLGERDSRPPGRPQPNADPP